MSIAKTTKIANPAKVFSYSIEMDGLIFATVQSIEIGELELGADEHGDGINTIKTPGKIKWPSPVFETLVPVETGDPYWWDWWKRAAKGELPVTLKKNFIVHVHNPGKTSILRSWLFEGVWPTKLKPSKLADMEEGNYIDTITTSIDNMEFLKM